LKEAWKKRGKECGYADEEKGGRKGEMRKKGKGGGIPVHRFYGGSPLVKADRKEGGVPLSWKC